MWDEDSYDIVGLKEEIIDYLETEGYLMPVAYTEIAEVERSNNLEFLLWKANKLGIDTDKYRL